MIDNSQDSCSHVTIIYVIIFLLLIFMRRRRTKFVEKSLDQKLYFDFEKSNVQIFRPFFKFSNQNDLSKIQDYSFSIVIRDPQWDRVIKSGWIAYAKYVSSMRKRYTALRAVICCELTRKRERERERERERRIKGIKYGVWQDAGFMLLAHYKWEA